MLRSKSIYKVLMIGAIGNPPYTGGIENVINTIIGSDLNKRFEFIIFDTYRKQDFKRKNLQRIFYALSLSIKLYLKIKKTKPDIIYIHFCSNMDFWKHSICLLIAKGKKIRTIFQLHGGNFKKVYLGYNAIIKKIVMNIFALPDIIIALSEYWFEFLSCLANSKKIRIINNPINYNYYANYSNMKKENVKREYSKILLIGRVGKHKGHYVAILAMSEVIKKFPKSLMLFAGPEEEEGAIKDLKKLSIKLDVKNSIQFLGSITGERKLNTINESSVIILPSYGENMPLSIMEGMAAKIPIVATSVGAVPELLENGKCGYLIKVGDYHELANSIMKILKEPNEAYLRAKNAQNKIRNKYSVEIVTKRIELIFDELIKN